MEAAVSLVENAPAKVNLTLRVLGRRADSYHDIESLVAFADLGDALTFTPGPALELAVHGPLADQTGAAAENLVLNAARALLKRMPNLRLGAFVLDKRLPTAAGLGSGSADAAAALRLLARANALDAGDRRLVEAARATGADVPVCLDPRPRLMRGIGEILSQPFELPALHAVLVNPGIALATKDVFAGWKPPTAPPPSLDVAAIANGVAAQRIVELLRAQANDLEPAAIKLVPAIAEVLGALQALPGCTFTRMSGSGPTCFGLFASAGESGRAADVLQQKFPRWWVRACVFGSAGR